MKATALTILFLSCLAHISVSQKHTNIIGGELGVNISNIGNSPSELTPGFRFGPYYDHFFTTDYGIGTGLIFSRQGSIQYNAFDRFTGESIPEYEFFDCLEIPLNIYLRLTHGIQSKANGFLFIGYSYGFLMSSWISNNPEFLQPGIPPSAYDVNITQHSLRLGFRIDHYLKKSKIISWGGFVNATGFSNPEYRGFAVGVTNYNAYFRFGKILGKKKDI